MDASFQLGYELTNALNPLGQAVSALKSLGLIEAIRKSGSDAITELRLASFIGRHRIDEAMKIHFREAVAKSGQSTISRYIDIVLEAGAGPTVQEALKNPALFSMVIQLSALAFSHEDESLANAIVEATERIAQRSTRDADIIPDYVSLLGTVRACRQQTASFHWAPLYEAVERKIVSALTKGGDGRLEFMNSNKRHRTHDALKTELRSLTNRHLPFKILESLLVGLLPLQSLEEHRILHAKSDSGISTIVVWCYHVLGIGVSVRFQDVEVNFGKEPGNIIIENSAAEDVCAIMMDPADPHEPLFALHIDENDPIISYEHRSQAFGFGLRVLMLEDLGSEELRRFWSHWIIAHCLIRVRDLLGPPETDKLRDLIRYEGTSSATLISASTIPSERSIMIAAKFTFAMDTVDDDLVEDFMDSPSARPEPFTFLPFSWRALMALIFALSRIHPNDLERCGNLPLSLPAFEKLDQKYLEIEKSTNYQMKALMKIPMSFHILCSLMLGASFSEDYIEHAVLVSAWGWSIFFGTIDALDPADVSACDIRLLQGVPARKGLRRSRIIDGPTDLIPLSTAERLRTQPLVVYFPGVSTFERREVLVGHQSDAFSVIQSFEWKPGPPAIPPAIEPDGSSKRKLKMGFRTMLELCADAGRFPPCGCDSNVLEPAQYLDSLFKTPVDSVSLRTNHNSNIIFKWGWLSPETIRKMLQPKNGSTIRKESGSIASLSELQEIILERRVEDKNGDPHSWMFYVSGNSASKWLQLLDMYHACGNKLKIILRGRSTCVECVFKSPLLDKLGPTLVLL
ncbi:MAG: hypothetical protein Q9195_006879 [Heterodermia aff. obscurata]